MIETYSRRVMQALTRAVVKYDPYISMRDIKSPCREKKVVYVRFICISIYHRLTGSTLKRTAEAFHRHHTSILYSLRTAEHEKSSNPAFKADYECFEGMVNEYLSDKAKEAEKAQKWLPEIGERYWTIELNVTNFSPFREVWNGDAVDQKYLERGWVFRTRSEASALCRSYEENL